MSRAGDAIALAVSAALHAALFGGALLVAWPDDIRPATNIDAVQVQRSAGHAALDRAAAEAVRKWRFEPARNGSVAAAVWVVVPVEFRLKEDF